MPRAFTDKENQYIRRKLMDVGLELFRVRGIRKVSVEELAQNANISKGAFYKYFDSKEALYFALLDEAQKKFKSDVLAAANTPMHDKIDSLKHIFKQAVNSWSENPLANRLDSNDLEYVLRKMPPEIIEEHMINDADFAKQLLKSCNAAGVCIDEQKSQLVAGLLRSVFLVSLHEERFPEEIFFKVIDVLFELIAEYIVKNCHVEQ